MAMEAYNRAKAIIEEHRDAMVRISEALLEREVLDGKEVLALIEGRSLAPLASPADDDEEEGEKQEILQPPPKPSRTPGLEGGQPSPA